MEYNRIIGSNIRFERRKKNLTIEDLSEILNIAPGFLGLIERGQRGTSIKNLCTSADLFGLTLDQLITEDLSGNLELKEPVKSDYDKKLETCESLIRSLNSDELEFIICEIRNLRKLMRDSEDYKY